MLDNLASNLQKEESSVLFSCGLRTSLIFADKLIARLRHTGLIHVSGFNLEKLTGLFFHDEVSRRAVKVTNHPVSGDVMIHCGKSSDFDFPSRASFDNVAVYTRLEAGMDDLVEIAIQYFTRS